MMKMEMGVVPVSSVAQTVDGPAYNRRGTTGADSGASVVVHLSVGSATGGPSTQSVTAFLADSADGSTDWQGAGSVTATLTNDDEQASGDNVNLVGFRKFIRASVTVAFTGGSSPEIPVAVTLCFGGRE